MEKWAMESEGLFARAEKQRFRVGEQRTTRCSFNKVPGPVEDQRRSKETWVWWRWKVFERCLTDCEGLLNHFPPFFFSFLLFFF